MGTTVSSASRRKPAAPEINVTPLVDVVLVLLIIFMVVTPQMESGENVELPQIQFPDEEGKGKLDPIELIVTSSGRMLLEKEEVAKEALPAALTAIHEKEPRRRLVLKGDARLGYGEAREVFVLAQQVGLPGVSLMVSEREGAKKSKQAEEPALLAEDEG